MAEIFPFRAYRYNAARVDPAKVLTQPYDKITPAMAEKYAAASPYNLIPVEKGKSLPTDTPENNVYTRAAKALDEWIRGGRDRAGRRPRLSTPIFRNTPCREPASGEFARDSSPWDVSKIIPQASFFATNRRCPGRKRTGWNYCGTRRRIRGSSSCSTTIRQAAWMRCSTAAAQGQPQVEVRDEYDVVHRLWPVTDARTIETIQRELADKKLVIADGHHRYETALAYRDECRARAGHAGSQRAVRKSDDDAVQYGRKGPDDPADAPRGRQCPGFFVRGFRAALGEHI